MVSALRSLTSHVRSAVANVAGVDSLSLSVVCREDASRWEK